MNENSLKFYHCPLSLFQLPLLEPKIFIVQCRITSKQTCVRNIPIMCKILNVIYNRSSKYLLSAKQKKAMNGEKKLQCQHL